MGIFPLINFWWEKGVSVFSMSREVDKWIIVNSMPLFQGRYCSLWGFGLPNQARLNDRDDEVPLCQDTEICLPSVTTECWKDF